MLSRASLNHQDTKPPRNSKNTKQESQKDLDEIEEAVRQIAVRRDDKPAAEFVVLGGLRYDRDNLAEMLGKVGAMLTPEMIEESSFYQMIIETGRVQEVKFRNSIRLRTRIGLKHCWMRLTAKDAASARDAIQGSR